MEINNDGAIVTNNGEIHLSADGIELAGGTVTVGGAHNAYLNRDSVFDTDDDIVIGTDAANAPQAADRLVIEENELETITLDAATRADQGVVIGRGTTADDAAADDDIDTYATNEDGSNLIFVSDVDVSDHNAFQNIAFFSANDIEDGSLIVGVGAGSGSFTEDGLVVLVADSDIYGGRGGGSTTQLEINASPEC
ncbi:MAG: hypothetical protein GXP02_06730 [Alphaproteobacteria bacterium]|nr:hypothetical protein [Alphaproteobacteria bacterium]